MGKIVGNPFHEGTRQNSSKFLKQNLVRYSIEGLTQVKAGAVRGRHYPRSE